MARKIKGKTLLKRKIKGLERENTVNPRMNKIVIVMMIHQRTQIFKGRTQNLQRKKCPIMSTPYQCSLPSLWQKRYGNLENNRKSGLKPKF